jgi:hypothetical protein
MKCSSDTEIPSVNVKLDQARVNEEMLYGYKLGIVLVKGIVSDFTAQVRLLRKEIYHARFLSLAV